MSLHDEAWNGMKMDNWDQLGRINVGISKRGKQAKRIRKVKEYKEYKAKEQNNKSIRFKE